MSIGPNTRNEIHEDLQQQAEQFPLTTVLPPKNKPKQYNRYKPTLSPAQQAYQDEIARLIRAARQSR
jgi:hypothetical protein